jgi:glycine cleavage system aminomethyltransferase T
MVLMPKDNKKKSNDYRGGSALLKKQQEANTKKFKAMTPAQKKSYVAKQAKAVGKTTAQVASMVGGAGLARKGGVAAARKIVPAKKVKLDESINKMKKVLSNSKGPARTTRASQPTTELERNIGRHSALRKKFPDKFKP